MPRVYVLLIATVVIILSVTTFPLTTLAEETSPSKNLTVKENNDNYLIGAGDILNIVVWKNEDFSGVFLVRPDGKTTLPLIGDIIAEGMSTDLIKVQIESKLKLFIGDPYVTVIVNEAASNRVYVLGEVQTPGVYPIQDRLSVIQALALAGGLTEFAKLDRMVVIRHVKNKQIKFDISYKQILKSPDGGHNLLLKRGDTLVVP